MIDNLKPFNINNLGNYIFLKNNLQKDMKKSIDELFRLNLRRIREDILKLSQANFCKRMNMKQTALSAMENNDKSIGKAFVERVCREFNEITYTDFLWEQDVKNTIIPLDPILSQLSTIFAVIDDEHKQMVLKYANRVKQFYNETKHDEKIIPRLRKANNNEQR